MGQGDPGGEHQAGVTSSRSRDSIISRRRICPMSHMGQWLPPSVVSTMSGLAGSGDASSGDCLPAPLSTPAARSSGSRTFPRGACKPGTGGQSAGEVCGDFGEALGGKQLPERSAQTASQRCRAGWPVGPITEMTGPDFDAHILFHLAFARGLATSRTHSMKSCATGLIVRFFRVVIAIGQGEMPRSTGKGLSASRVALKCSTEPGQMAR